MPATVNDPVFAGHKGKGDGITEVRRQETPLVTGALQNAILNSANFSSIATDETGVIQIFNVGADQPYSVNELAQAIAKAMGVEPEIKHLPARSEVIDAYSSHAKVDRIFGKRTPTSLDEGLGRMAAWVRTHGARQSQKFKNIEVNKNFPAAWRD